MGRYWLQSMLRNVIIKIVIRIRNFNKYMKRFFFTDIRVSFYGYFHRLTTVEPVVTASAVLMIRIRIMDLESQSGLGYLKKYNPDRIRNLRSIWYFFVTDMRSIFFIGSGWNVIQCLLQRLYLLQEGQDRNDDQLCGHGHRRERLQQRQSQVCNSIYSKRIAIPGRQVLS